MAPVQLIHSALQHLPRAAHVRLPTHRQPQQRPAQLLLPRRRAAPRRALRRRLPLLPYRATLEGGPAQRHHRHVPAQRRCAPSLADDVVNRVIEVSPIPAEATGPPRPRCFEFLLDPSADSEDNLLGEDGELFSWLPLKRDIPRGCWTVPVSRMVHRLRQDPDEMRLAETEDFRYAFVRAAQTIPTNPPPRALGPAEIEVVGLKEFLRATTAAGEVDLAAMDRRLDDFCRVADTIGPNWLPPPWSLPSGVERLAVMSHDEAASTPLGSLASPRRVQDSLYKDVPLA